jgi:DNA-binding transcriptional ArsR family regulator
MSTPTSAAANRVVSASVAEIQAHVGDAAGLLKALANEQRLLVLCSLLEGALAVGEINRRVPLSQSAVSQHLGVLRAAGVVTTRRESQTIFYSLTPGPAVRIMEALYDAFCAPTPERARTSGRKRSNS